MLNPYVQDKHLVLGIPAGGVPVGVVVAVVADAYERWSDVDESKVLNNLEQVWGLTPTQKKDLNFAI